MIENAVTSETFDTVVLPLTEKNKTLIVKKDWLFDWKGEIGMADRQVYRLATIGNPKVVQGLLSLTDQGDHFFAHLIENAKFNRGKGKLYRNVPANLMAFACMQAFKSKYDGVVLFVSKTVLVEHYRQTLGAKIFASNKMFIDTPEAVALVRTHFKDFKFASK